GPMILEDPEVWGVERLGADGVSIRLVVKTTPADQFKVARELRARLKTCFDEAGIEIPFPQRVIWHRDGSTGSTGPTGPTGPNGSGQRDVDDEGSRLPVRKLNGDVAGRRHQRGQSGHVLVDQCAGL